jgi:Flp pilus assembly protein TadB
MKLTKKDFENVVNGRVEEELKRTKANRPIAYLGVAAVAVSVIVINTVSGIAGILLFVVLVGAGLLWARRNFRKTANRIRIALLQEWKGYIEGVL